MPAQENCNNNRSYVYGEESRWVCCTRAPATHGVPGWKRAYIDGGTIIQSLMRKGLIADMTLTVIPILIGEGKRMFGALDSDIDLHLLESTSFPSGLVTSRYEIA
ncbi:dihydrofolate reductase family protein [Falsihalocynthiibacter sp. S25ZX9]|uniref:dihydrofolate reductase family protein n=1 Tax=Falsihalocynthiibacter sp. S25ZX9 TaxID=3240870 RepID=UPI003510CBEA